MITQIQQYLKQFHSVDYKPKDPKTFFKAEVGYKILKVLSLHKLCSSVKEAEAGRGKCRLKLY